MWYTDLGEGCLRQLANGGNSMINHNNAHYGALDVAKYCLYYCTKIGNPISNLQLQKILYYVQAKFLVERNAPCFKDAIVAWKYGPVVESVYHNYKYNFADAIKVKSNTSEISVQDQTLINDICDIKSACDAFELVRATHEEDPWREIWGDEFESPNSGASISNESLYKYFAVNRGLLAKA